MCPWFGGAVWLGQSAVCDRPRRYRWGHSLVLCAVQVGTQPGVVCGTGGDTAWCCVRYRWGHSLVLCAVQVGTQPGVVCGAGGCADGGVRGEGEGWWSHR